MIRLFFLLILLSFELNSQHIDLLSGYGRTFNHSDKFVEDPSTTPSFHFNLEYQHKNIYGASLGYTHLSGSDLYGRAVWFSRSINISILQKSKIEIIGQLGTGIAHLNRTFYNTSGQNTAIGSSLNNVSHVGLKIRYRWKRLNFITGISLQHFSNAAIKQPNLGLNYGNVYAGLRYIIAPLEKSIYSINQLNVKKSDHALFIQIGYYDYDFRQFDDVNKYATTWVIAYEYDVVNYSSWQMALGLLTGFDTGRERRQGVDKAWYLGIFSEARYELGPMAYFFRAGWYARQKYAPDLNFFFSAGMLREFTLLDKSLLIGISLKFHSSVAEYPEFFIGRRF